MANADSFTNQKTGNKIDLVDSGAREQIEELNETLTECYNVLFYRGTRIPDGSDLDDYTTPGKYYVESSKNAATILNMPDGWGESHSFSMFVFYLALYRRMQLLIRNTPGDRTDIFYFRINGDDGFGSWKVIEGTIVG